VVFRGRKVDMRRHEFRVPPPRPQPQGPRTQSSGAKKKRKSQP
jgi:hypothetical protein